jgi:glycosyltransferase involved in cell wall biosynthesis
VISLSEEGTPVRYSAPFTFCKVGVEFCIGFHSFEKEQETLLRFWISRHDRDTTVFTTPFRHLPLEFLYEKKEETPSPIILPKITISNKSAQPIPQVLTNMPITPINIFILCYNEELILPHTLRHYRTHLPHAYITIYDNESTDRSREIAEEWGCRVVSWSSGNQQNEYIQQNIKNDAWKSESPYVEVKIDPRPECSGRGWKIMVDMDEWVTINEEQLAEEEKNGTTILRLKGINVIGQSQSETLEDISPYEIHQWNRVIDWKPESKNLCFLYPSITEMNYTRGAHACKPEGERIQYSKNIYHNKHMENMGLSFFVKKFTLRKQRNITMQQRSINLHYTDDVAELTNRYQSLLENSYLLENFGPITDENYVLETDYHYT